ncbi:unnamed protein product [Cyprideis torosa]|uniref:Arginase n=1 Tax=Cyprideis torosa TaxID=163714 RepID=A0A7R8W327_9CRUS|nr:unnamed protein product [Cyprideis torosa]CAG0882576.1 unnamed protein product [Cyprideis torosa]
MEKMIVLYIFFNAVALLRGESPPDFSVSLCEVVPPPSSASVGIIDAKIWQGQEERGVEDGPREIRRLGIIDKIEDLGHEVNDYGAVDAGDESFGKEQQAKYRQYYEFTERLKSMVEKSVEENNFTVVLGGDHSLVYGAVSGSQPKGLIYVDAHSDINTPMTSCSDNIHGMPVAFLIKELAEYIPYHGQRVPPCLNANQVAYIALRDVDPLERTILDEFNIRTYDMSAVDRLGIDAVVAEILELLGDTDLHLSFDLDSLEPSITPCVGTPVLGGLTLREGIRIFELFKDKIIALDINEFNPRLAEKSGDCERTGLTGIRLVEALLGLERRGPLTSQELPKP